MDFLDAYPYSDINLAPSVGIDIKANRYTALGDSKTKFAITSEYDIGRALAQLSILALDPKTSASVPEEVRIVGDNVNYEDIRDAVARVKGVPTGQIVVEDLAAHKKSVQDRKTELIFEFIRSVNHTVITTVSLNSVQQLSVQSRPCGGKGGLLTRQRERTRKPGGGAMEVEDGRGSVARDAMR